MYVLFFGYYTIVRQWIGRLRPRSVALAAECPTEAPMTSGKGTRLSNGLASALT